MTLNLETRKRPGRRSPRLLAALVGVAGLVSWTLAGCSDPDDGEGGGGGGYFAQQSIDQELD